MKAAVIDKPGAISRTVRELSENVTTGFDRMSHGRTVKAQVDPASGGNT